MTLKTDVIQAADARILQERARVDDYIITTNLTLIAGFAAILTLSKKPVGVAAYLPAVALVLLILSLLSFLWHKFRHPIRLRQLEVRRAEISYEFADKIVDFLETFVQPNPEIVKAIAKAQVDPKTRETSPYYNRARDVIVAHLRNAEQEISTAHKAAMMKPLPERGSRLLYFADVTARRLRYPSIALAVLLFLVAVMKYLF